MDPTVLTADEFHRRMRVDPSNPSVSPAMSYSDIEASYNHNPHEATGNHHSYVVSFSDEATEGVIRGVISDIEALLSPHASLSSPARGFAAAIRSIKTGKLVNSVAKNTFDSAYHFVHRFHSDHKGTGAGSAAQNAAASMVSNLLTMSHVVTVDKVQFGSLFKGFRIHCASGAEDLSLLSAVLPPNPLPLPDAVLHLLRRHPFIDNVEATKIYSIPKYSVGQPVTRAGVEDVESKTAEVERHLAATSSAAAPSSDAQVAEGTASASASAIDDEATTTTTPPTPPPKPTSVNWGIDRITHPALPLTREKPYRPAYTGKGIHVFVIDTGIDLDHSEFVGRSEEAQEEVDINTAYRGGDGSGRHRVVANVFNAFTDMSKYESEAAAKAAITDDVGHGTHCAGVIGGNTVGVARNSHMYGVKILDATGHGSSIDIASGVQYVYDWAMAQKAEGLDPSQVVLSMSLGGPCVSYKECSEHAVVKAVQKLVSAGFTSIVAAGNSDCDACLTSPAFVSSAVTVGASSPTDSGAVFSDYGKCVDIYAPGVDIMSACAHVLCPTDSMITVTAKGISLVSAPSTKFTPMSGTSMATPHVAGVAAQLLEMQPGATPADVSQMLACSAVRNKLNFGVQEGYGMTTTTTDGLGGGSSLSTTRNLLLQTPKQVKGPGGGRGATASSTSKHSSKSHGNGGYDLLSLYSEEEYSALYCDLGEGCKNECSGHGYCAASADTADVKISEDLITNDDDDRGHRQLTAPDDGPTRFCQCNTDYFGSDCHTVQYGEHCEDGYVYVDYNVYNNKVSANTRDKGGKFVGIPNWSGATMHINEVVKDKDGQKGSKTRVKSTGDTDPTRPVLVTSMCGGGYTALSGLCLKPNAHYSVHVHLPEGPSSGPAVPLLTRSTVTPAVSATNNGPVVEHRYAAAAAVGWRICDNYGGAPYNAQYFKVSKDGKCEFVCDAPYLILTMRDSAKDGWNGGYYRISGKDITESPATSRSGASKETGSSTGGVVTYASGNMIDDVAEMTHKICMVPPDGASPKDGQEHVIRGVMEFVAGVRNFESTWSIEAPDCDMGDGNSEITRVLNNDFHLFEYSYTAPEEEEATTEYEIGANEAVSSTSGLRGGSASHSKSKAKKHKCKFSIVAPPMNSHNKPNEVSVDISNGHVTAIATSTTDNVNDLMCPLKDDHTVFTPAVTVGAFLSTLHNNSISYTSNTAAQVEDVVFRYDITAEDPRVASGALPESDDAPVEHAGVSKAPISYGEVPVVSHTTHAGAPVEVGKGASVVYQYASVMGQCLEQTSNGKQGSVNEWRLKASVTPDVSPATSAAPAASVIDPSVASSDAARVVQQHSFYVSCGTRGYNYYDLHDPATGATQRSLHYDKFTHIPLPADMKPPAERTDEYFYSNVAAPSGCVRSCLTLSASHYDHMASLSNAYRGSFASASARESYAKHNLHNDESVTELRKQYVLHNTSKILSTVFVMQKLPPLKNFVNSDPGYQLVLYTEVDTLYKELCLLSGIPGDVNDATGKPSRSSTACYRMVIGGGNYLATPVTWKFCGLSDIPTNAAVDFCVSDYNVCTNVKVLKNYNGNGIVNNGLEISEDEATTNPHANPTAETATKAAESKQSATPCADQNTLFTPAAEKSFDMNVLLYSGLATTTINTPFNVTGVDGGWRDASYVVAKLPQLSIFGTANSGSAGKGGNTSATQPIHNDGVIASTVDLVGFGTMRHGGAGYGAMCVTPGCYVGTILPSKNDNFAFKTNLNHALQWMICGVTAAPGIPVFFKITQAGECVYLTDPLACQSESMMAMMQDIALVFGLVVGLVSFLAALYFGYKFCCVGGMRSMDKNPLLGGAAQTHFDNSSSSFGSGSGSNKGVSHGMNRSYGTGSMGRGEREQGGVEMRQMMQTATATVTKDDKSILGDVGGAVGNMAGYLQSYVRNQFSYDPISSQENDSEDH